MKKIFFVAFALFFSTHLIYSQTMSITYKSISQNESSLNDSVTAIYPQVDFGPEALMGIRGIAQDINTSLDTLVKEMIKRFDGEVFLLDDKNVNGMGSMLEITSTANISGGTLLSVQISEFKNLSGNAHPLTTITTFNYSITSVGILNMSNLFLKDSDYLNYVSDFSINELRIRAKKEGYENIDDMITSGASAKQENFTNWLIHNDSLEIIFNPYQVAPYVFGIQSVTISLSSMLIMIDPKGPLNYMFR